MKHTVTILMTGFVTHDVRRFVVTRPDGLDFEPGQGVEIAVGEPHRQEKGRPFTPTSLRDDRVVEFTIKEYPAHHGVTEKLGSQRAGSTLLMSDPFGTITYRGTGTFIAGGAGITPFLAILRQLARDDALDGHTLLFSNKTPADVICERELRHYLGERCILTCTRRSAPGYLDRRIDRDLLEQTIRDVDQRFYVCGPPRFVKDVTAALAALGATSETMVLES